MISAAARRHYINNRRKRKRAQGLCAECPRVSGDRYLCEHCQTKHHAHSRAAYAVQRRATRKAAGFCSDCPNLTDGQHVRCLQCRAQRAQQAAERRARG